MDASARAGVLSSGGISPNFPVGGNAQQPTKVTACQESGNEDYDGKSHSFLYIRRLDVVLAGAVCCGLHLDKGTCAIVAATNAGAAHHTVQSRLQEFLQVNKGGFTSLEGNFLEYRFSISLERNPGPQVVLKETPLWQ